MSAPEGTVLVVDDDPDHALIIHAVLSALAPRVEVRLCADAVQLLALLAQTPGAALLLIDRRLGLVESFVAIAEVRRRRPQLAIVMLSAILSASDRARALAAGASATAEKPASLAGWHDLLGGLLGALAEPARGASAA